jgi:hypothetical protein
MLPQVIACLLLKFPTECANALGVCVSGAHTAPLVIP